MNWLNKFFNSVTELGQMSRDARTGNLLAQPIRDKYKLAASEKDSEKRATLQNEALESAKQALITEASMLPMYIAPINLLTEGLVGTAYGVHGGIDLLKNKPWLKTDSKGNKRSTTERVLNTGIDALMLLGGAYGGKQLSDIKNAYSLLRSGNASIGNALKLDNAIKELNSTTKQPLNYLSTLDKATLSGKAGWSPSEVFQGRHGSTEPLTHFYPRDRWDVVNRGASPYEYFLTDLKSATNMMDERPFQYIVDTEVKKPIVQIGEFNLKGQKNSTRNELVSGARLRGADGYILNGIADNKTKNQRVLIKYIDQNGEPISSLKRLDLFDDVIEPEVIEPEIVTTPDFSHRVVPGRYLYLYRTERLGVDPHDWIRANNILKEHDPKTFEEFERIVKTLDPEISDETVLKYWLSPHYGRDYKWIHNRRDSYVYQNNPFAKDDYRIADNHEFTHYLLNFNNDENAKYLYKALSEANCNNLDDIFYNLDDLLNQGVPDRIANKISDYILNESNGGTEIIARIGQIKDFLGLRAGEDLTEDMLRYAMRNYKNYVGVDNMSYFFDIIKNIKNFVKFANTPSVKKYAGMLTGAVAGEELIKNPNYLELNGTK